MLEWNRLRLIVITSVFACAALALLPAGCPLGTSGSGLTAGDDTSDTGTSGPAGSTTTDGSAPTSAGDESDGGGANGPPGMGTLLVETIDGAANTYFDIYELPGQRGIRSYQESNTAVFLAPGLYELTQYFNSDFVYATNVTIAAGTTTTVSLGAIQLLTVTNAVDGSFDIYDPTGQTEYSSYNAPSALITAPEGTFVLKEYFNPSFDYAREVTVVAGETTTVAMGGIKLVTVSGAADGTYGIYDSAGATAYATYKEPNVIITAPAGTFTLKEYFNPDFTYASDVAVVAGEVTEVPMGAIRYTGTLAYDIYAGGALVSSYNEAGLIITAPAGTYTLTEYFDDENVLANNVVVTVGAITDVP